MNKETWYIELLQFVSLWTDRSLPCWEAQPSHANLLLGTAWSKQWWGFMCSTWTAVFYPVVRPVNGVKCILNIKDMAVDLYLWILLIDIISTCIVTTGSIKHCCMCWPLSSCIFYFPLPFFSLLSVLICSYCVLFHSCVCVCVWCVLCLLSPVNWSDLNQWVALQKKPLLLTTSNSVPNAWSKLHATLQQISSINTDHVAQIRTGDRQRCLWFLSVPHNTESSKHSWLYCCGTVVLLVFVHGTM